jgi:hypothetical protein
MDTDFLDVTGKSQFDDSVIKITHHSYLPHNTLAINNSDEIRICINNQDLLTLPCKSYLYIKGKIDNHEKGHFINNAFAFLFDEIRYEVAGKEIDIVRNPGISSLMKILCSHNKKLTNVAFDTDENLKKFHKSGKFSVCVPMELLMGVFEDFNKVLVNVKQELVLKRSKNDYNCVLTTTTYSATAGTADVIPKITLETIQWVMPHIVPSDSEKLQLQKMLLQNKNLQIAFRSMELHELPSCPKTKKHTWSVKTSSNMEKPRFVIFGFQTERDNKPRKRSDEFDHCKLKNLKVFLNSEYYPYQDLNLDFENGDIAKAYEMFLRFRESYYNVVLDPMISRTDFINKYPLIVIDCSRQNEAIKEGVVDIKLEIECDQNIPDETSAYCLIIHDKVYEYNPLTNEINKV